LHQVKKLLIAKEIITRMKRQPIEWNKIIASYSFDMGLIFIIYKKLQKLNSKEQIIQLTNMQMH
jgi:hypothetical protein